MSVLNSIPTEQGISILESELKSKVTKFVLVGSARNDNVTLEDLLNSSNVTYQDIENNIFYLNDLSKSYYDSVGKLSFEVYIPHADDFRDYLYAICLLTEDNELVVASSLGAKFQPVKGFGMTVTIAVPISGSAGEVVFKNSNFVLDTELEKYKEESGASLLQVVVNLGNSILKN